MPGLLRSAIDGLCFRFLSGQAVVGSAPLRALAARPGPGASSRLRLASASTGFAACEWASRRPAHHGLADYGSVEAGVVSAGAAQGAQSACNVSDRTCVRCEAIGALYRSFVQLVFGPCGCVQFGGGRSFFARRADGRGLRGEECVWPLEIASASAVRRRLPGWLACACSPRPCRVGWVAGMSCAGGNRSTAFTGGLPHLASYSPASLTVRGESGPARGLGEEQEAPECQPNRGPRPCTVIRAGTRGTGDSLRAPRRLQGARQPPEVLEPAALMVDLGATASVSRLVGGLSQQAERAQLCDARGLRSTTLDKVLYNA